MIGCENLFLIVIAFVWCVFASVQDLKYREVANWLSFSLVLFGLAYRGFYSLNAGSVNLFVYGVLGGVLFFVLSHLFYYSKVFAGGDAKLLIGMGVVLPYTRYTDVLLLGLGFVVLLFFVGAVYGLVYSVFLVMQFREKFKRELRKMKKMFILFLGISLVFIILGVFLIRGSVLAGYIAFFVILPFIYVYVKALDKCMVKMANADELVEGDWLEEDVIVNGKTIKKSVHGLDMKEIIILRRFGKKVLIKEGIPFVPAFLISLIIMVFFWEALFSFLQSLALVF